jgi:hypothetical protein
MSVGVDAHAASPPSFRAQARTAPGDTVVRQSVSPRRTLLVLLAIAVAFALISGLGRVVRWYLVPPDSLLSRIFLLFDVNLEHNFPAYYSSILLLACAPVLFFIAAAERRRGAADTAYWTGLGVIFVLLSVDEAVELHGRLNPIMNRIFGDSGVFYYGWVIAALAGLVVLAVIFLRFLLRLPLRTRALFVLSGGVFVVGAVGLEMAADYLMSTTVVHTPRTYALATLFEHSEEFLEMCGVSLFLYALLDYIRTHHAGVHLKIHLRDS